MNNCFHFKTHFSHSSCYRLLPESFKYLVALIGFIIAKGTTCLQEQISAKMPLVVTLRYLAFGETQQSLTCSYRFGPMNVSKIAGKTYQAKGEVFSWTYLKYLQSVS